MRRRLAIIVIGIGSALHDFGLRLSELGFWILPADEQAMTAGENGHPDLLHDAVLLSDPTEDLPSTG